MKLTIYSYITMDLLGKRSYISCAVEANVDMAHKKGAESRSLDFIDSLRN